MKESPLASPQSIDTDQFAVHVEEYGNGDDVCILLHGFGEGGYAWYDLVTRLPKSFRAIIVDFRGHGNSPADPSANYDAETYCNDVLNIIGKQQLRDISLIGHSLGGAVSLRVAAAIPELVSNLILVDFSLKIGEQAHDQILQQFHEQCDGFASRAEYAAWFEDRRPLTHPRTLRHIVENALQETAEGRFSLKADPRIQRMLEQSAASTNDYEHLLSSVLCRALLIRGKGSAVLSKGEASEILDILSNGQYCEIGSAGHSVMVENPDGFADAVNQFLIGCYPGFWR